jgi:hypothetical protein
MLQVKLSVAVLLHNVREFAHLVSHHLVLDWDFMNRS